MTKIYDKRADSLRALQVACRILGHDWPGVTPTCKRCGANWVAWSRVHTEDQIERELERCRQERV